MTVTREGLQHVYTIVRHSFTAFGSSCAPAGIVVYSLVSRNEAGTGAVLYITSVITIETDGFSDAERI